MDKGAHIERAGSMVGHYQSMNPTVYELTQRSQIWDAINDGTIFSCPSLLASFSAICFADLKKYKFSYHFAYPALHSDPPWRLASEATAPKRFSVAETVALVDKVQTWRYSVDTRQHGFFLAKKVRRSYMDDDGARTPKDGASEQGIGSAQDLQEPQSPVTPSTPDPGFTWVIGSLSSFESGFFDKTDLQDRYVCFADPSTYPNNPGWMLRNLLVLVRRRFKLGDVQILCYRDTHVRREQPSSIILDLRAGSSSAGTESAGSVPTTQHPGPPIEDTSETPIPIPPSTKHSPPPKITGWERNDLNKIISRTVDLAAYLDPARLADQAVDLNLKLIKWRIAPSIDLDIIKSTSYLLLGAGTLGSYVARNLMGWGARKITFVDNARVSYSNPVRQPLYDFKDCLNGGAKKAERAAEVLKEIYPGIDAEGHVMSVPMAGHPVVDETKVKADYDKLYQLIQNHDAIFLLMDTRESRWLPTVMAKAAGKIVINAALGFDTYMVMRHGVRPQSTSTSVSPATTSRQAQEEELGCYFCSDVVAPADSLKSATLDQQCTVTRPGVAPLASALAVELLISILQSPLKARVAAPSPAPRYSPSNSDPAPLPSVNEKDKHPLGTVPHQLRGFLANWQTMIIKGKAYDCCSACSPSIVGAYERDGWGFVKRAINEKGFVEEISGLAEVQRRAEEAEKDVDWSSEGEEDLEAEEII